MRLIDFLVEARFGSPDRISRMATLFPSQRSTGGVKQGRSVGARTRACGRFGAKTPEEYLGEVSHDKVTDGPWDGACISRRSTSQAAASWIWARRTTRVWETVRTFFAQGRLDVLERGDERNKSSVRADK